MEKGTTWTYSYAAYEASPSNLEQTIRAEYQLIETVTDTTSSDRYFVAHIQRDYKLIEIDPSWTGDHDASLPGEYWYVFGENKMYESRSPVGPEPVKLDISLLSYEFPLSLGKAWCLQRPNAQSPNPGKSVDCEYIGKRMITQQGAYETPAGTFEDCYELTDYYNGGNVIHWFCAGIGVVYRRFDHAGTRFGFEQILTGMSPGRS